VENLYVITGGPGVGKTTLLNEISKSGYKTVEEEARKIIKEQIEMNGDALPWKNKQLYAKLMLERSVKAYEEISKTESSEIIFFDRGILDTFCYIEMENIRMPGKIKQMAIENRYNKNVFILPPWKDIYQTDNERRQSWKEALYTFNSMKNTYVKYGYEVIIVPKVNIENRLQFILEQISASKK